MPLDVQVIERQPVPTGTRFWDAVMRIVPLAFAPTATRMQLRAPRGKTGKLARRVQVRAKRVSQGFIQGVEVQFIVGVPYGHLVAQGHRIIARGEQRKGLKLSTVDRTKRRTALKRRRAAGAAGFVPANPFATQTLAEDRAAAIGRIESGLRALRAV
jgi:hypothetical protein